MPTIVGSQPELEIVDYRHEPRPLTLLKPLLDRDDVRIWREGPTAMDIPGDNRRELSVASTLVIWTLPPGPDVLQVVMVCVSPSKIYLFGDDPGLDRTALFLKYLAGLVKYAMNNNDRWVSVSALAEATASRESIVRLGLAWLEAQGLITVVVGDGDTVQLMEGGERCAERAADIAEQLNALLGEVVAYRRYFLRADVETLLRSL